MVKKPGTETVIDSAEEPMGELVGNLTPEAINKFLASLPADYVPPNTYRRSPVVADTGRGSGVAVDADEVLTGGEKGSKS